MFALLVMETSVQLARRESDDSRRFRFGVGLFSLELLVYLSHYTG